MLIVCKINKYDVWPSKSLYMQIAHEILKVPLGIPMNLVILDFSLEAPISREGTLRVTATKENLPKTSSLNNIIKLSLFSNLYPII